MDRCERDLFAFLIGNMKDMELELRAQSLVFEALAEKVIAPENLREALDAARESTAMRELVREKYALLASSGVAADEPELAALLRPTAKRSTLIQ